MANRPSPDRPDPPEPRTWLQRQWAKLRAARWRDVILANVEAGAENVAVGKNIFQINVGGRNITPYVVVIAGVALLLASYFFYPYVEPLWNPYQMEGDTNIVVADFGQMGQDGAIHRSAFGSILSQSVFEQLVSQYQEIEADNLFDGHVVIWHDSLSRNVKNVRFGIVRGASADERGAAAEALAQRVGADMVIYGHLTDQADPEGLVLEFYFASPAISDEPDAVVGHHHMGRAVPAALDLFAIDPTTAKAQARQPLADRSKAIFYLTLGLSHGLANDHERALATFQRAEAVLTAWRDADGKAVLYYFMGRSALLARRHDVAEDALRKALDLNPDYVNALITLGSVYIDRAQLFFVKDRELPPDIAACIPARGYENAAPSLDAAVAEIEQGLHYLDEAVDKAPAATRPPLKSIAMMTRAIGQNLRGQAAIWAGDLIAADEAVAMAQADFQIVADAFSAVDQPRYVAWSYLGNGLAHLLDGHLRVLEAFQAEAQGDASAVAAHRAEAIARIEAASDLFDACIEQAQSRVLRADLLFQKFILDCGCRPYRQQAEQTLQEQTAALD